LVEVYTISCDTLFDSEQEKQKLLDQLPEITKARLKRFRNDLDFTRSLAGEALARFLLSQKTGKNSRQIIFKINEKGKPSITGPEQIHFNISHSGKWVTVAVSNAEVGIDIELIREPQFRIAERYFSEEELADLNKLTGANKVNYFFDLWTLKESFLKLLGRGLTRSLGSFTIRKEKDNFRLKYSLDQNDQNIYFNQYSIDPEYKLSVCSVSGSFVPVATQIKVHEIIGNESE
jgi:4'-phosphopantetheinyl transferase